MMTLLGAALREKVLVCLVCMQTVESRISLRIRAHWSESFRRTQTETRGYKKIMLNSAEYEILPAYKC